MVLSFFHHKDSFFVHHAQMQSRICGEIIEFFEAERKNAEAIDNATFVGNIKTYVISILLLT